VASLQLELEFLAAATGEAKYATMGRRAMAALLAAEPLADSLYPMYISPDTGGYLSTVITLGARGDSLYEYLLKQYLLAGGLRAAAASARSATPDAAGAEHAAALGGNPALLSAGTPVGAYAPPPASPARGAWRAAGAVASAELARAEAGGNDAASGAPYICTDVLAGPCDAGSAAACIAAPDLCPAFPWYLGAAPGGSDDATPSSLATERAWFTAVYGAYLRSAAGIEAHLLRHSKPSGRAYIAERTAPGAWDDKMDHLVCFLPGVLALSSLTAPTRALRDRHLRLATDLMATCIHMYDATATGLAAEITRFPAGGDPVPDPGAKHNLLRPETVESLMVLYRVTGDATYRDAGWRIFNAFRKWSAVSTGGFSTLNDVTSAAPEQTNNQESFWLAETLKYLYLLFSASDVIPLDAYVFNTEAHPLPVFDAVPHL